MSAPLILEEGLYLLLTETAAITALTGPGIYMNAVPQNAHDPCMFFSTISAQPGSTNDGPSGFNIRRYQFETLSQSFVTAKRLQAAIRVALDGYVGTLPNGQRVFDIIRDNELDGFDDQTGEHRTITDYFVHFLEDQGTGTTLTPGVGSIQAISPGTISAYVVVAEGSGGLFVADNTNSNSVNAVVGITTNGATAGAAITVATSGPITYNGWNWVQGLPVFLSTGGALTQTVPTTGFSQQMGTALGATQVLVDIQPPILLT